jgi:hypothetical protein
MRSRAESMDGKKIDRDDIRALTKENKGITRFIEINPGEGIMSAFSVRMRCRGGPLYCE